MDFLSFISSLVSSLAWPVTILLSVFLLRKPLAELIPLIQRLKYKDLEIEFNRRVEEIRAEVQHELPQLEKLPQIPADQRAAIARLAEVSPSAAVLEAWRGVEVAVLNATQKAGQMTMERRARPLEAIRALEQVKGIDRNLIHLLHELRSLRNEAAHAPDFALSKSAALEFAESAESIIRYLKSLGQET